MSSELLGLDIAIDHRIRRQIKPSRRGQEGHSIAHFIKLEDLYRSLDRIDHFEFLVTADLAGHLRTGGILVILHRPTNKHPFTEGTDRVVEESPTLRALRDAFELFDISLPGEVSLIDAFPFLPRTDMRTMSVDAYNAQSKRHFSSFLGAVVAKQPHVALCMWQCDKEVDLTCFESGRDLQSIGVGKVFSQPKIKLCDESGAQTDLFKVNAFHPSYAVNHHPEHSCFRQLLLLEIAHACGLWRGDWNEEPWMEQLRKHCQDLSSRLGCISGPPTLQALRSKYANTLSRICHSIINMISTLRGKFRLRSELYKELVHNNWTELFNDCALCLTEVDKRMKAQKIDLQSSYGISSDISVRTMGLALNTISMIDLSVAIELNSQDGTGLFSRRFTEIIQKASGAAGQLRYRDRHPRKIIIELIVKLGKCFTSSRDEKPHMGAFHLVMALSQASQTFLDAARDTEVLLDEMWKGNREPSTTNEDDLRSDLQQVPADSNKGQMLSEGISRMRLVEKSNTKRRFSI